MSAASRHAEREEKKRAAAGPQFGTGGDNLHVFPTEENMDLIGHDALEHLEKQEATRSAMQERIDDEESKVYLYYIQCERGHQAIYFKKKPQIGQRMKDNDWFAAYKPTDKQRPMTILCQVCLRREGEKADGKFAGIKTHLHITENDDETFTADHEYIWRIPRDAKMAAVMGPSRAFKSKWTSNNLWESEYNEKLKENGYAQ